MSKTCLVQATVNFREALIKGRQCLGEEGDPCFADISPTALLHTVAALYVRSLPALDEDDIYQTLSSTSTRTVVLVRKVSDVVAEKQCGAASVDASKTSSSPRRMQSSSSSMDESLEVTSNSSKTTCPEAGEHPADKEEHKKVLARAMSAEKEDGKGQQQEAACLCEHCGDKAKNENEERSLLLDVFSDNEDEKSDDEDESDEDGEEDDFGHYFKDKAHFVEAVRSRRLLRRQGNITPDTVGVENQLVGAATYQWIASALPRENVVQLCLLAVRPNCRRLGVGSRLLRAVKDRVNTGQYSCIVTFADEAAVKFYKHRGFLEDPVLESKYRPLATEWDNCTFLCFMPPYDSLFDDCDEENEANRQEIATLARLETNLENCRKRMVEAYQEQVTAMERMRSEITILHAKLDSKAEVIERLTRDLAALRLENESLRQKARAMFTSERERLAMEALESEIRSWQLAHHSSMSPPQQS